MDICILIVEDERDLSGQVRLLVETLGYVYKYLPDPSAMWKTLEETRVDLILLDMYFEKTQGVSNNGIIWLKIIKEHSDFQSIPVIMMTEATDPAALATCFEYGAEDCLIKPLEKLVFNARVNNIIEYQRDLQAMQAHETLIGHQKQLLVDQHQQLTKSGKDIYASIKYARRIQEAMLPEEQQLQQVFEDSFILWKPLNIVSGDFCWYTTQEGKYFMVVADCTGHGVPGAFMSMLGNTLLNDSIIHKKMRNPEAILQELDWKIRFTLQKKERIRDGMDLAICVIDPAKKTLTYSGAHHPMVYMKQGEFHVLKGSNASIGGYQENKSFEVHTLDISVPVTFYLFSDGYQDQFGSVNQRRFSRKRLYSLLEEIHHEPMKKQKKILAKNLLQWIKEGKEKQIDDIMIVGVKLS